MKRILLSLYFLFYFISFAGGEEKKILFSLNHIGEKSLAGFIELADYINKRQSVYFKPVLESDYATALKKLAEKEVDIAFLCSGPYTLGKGRYNLEAIVAMKPDHNVEYRTYIVVPASSDIKTFHELKGKTFAFVDLLSYTGRLLPLYMIKKMGENPKTFFSRVIYTKSHEKSLEAVIKGEVDGAAVLSILVESKLRENPSLRKKIKIIEKSEKQGFPVFATTKNTSEKEKETLKNILLRMHQDQKGKEIPKKLEIKYFFVPSDREYDGIRKQYEEIKELVPQGIFS